MRCVVLDDYQDVALAAADWGVLADRVEVRSIREHLAGEDAVIAELAEADAVVVMRERTPLPASLFARLPRLRLVVTSGMRNASIDLAAAAEHGVTVCGTASSKAPPTELTWALILSLARHVAQENAAFHDGGPWQSTVGVELAGRRLGILGLGSIGERVARIGAAFGMEVTAWSQNLTRDRTDALGVELAPSLADLARSSDVLTVHLVLGDRTRRPRPPRDRPHAPDGVPGEHRTVSAGRHRRAGRGVAGEPDRGRGPRRVRPRAAAGRARPADAAQRPRHTAPRLRRPRQLPDLLHRGRRGHRRLPGR